MMTPELRRTKFFKALAEALIGFESDKVGPMAAAVGWKWRDEPPNTERTQEILYDLLKWADKANWSKPLEVSSDYTAGFSLHAFEDEETDAVFVTIRWGLSSEGECA